MGTVLIISGIVIGVLALLVFGLAPCILSSQISREQERARREWDE